MECRQSTTTLEDDVSPVLGFDTASRDLSFTPTRHQRANGWRRSTTAMTATPKNYGKHSQRSRRRRCTSAATSARRCAERRTAADTRTARPRRASGNLGHHDDEVEHRPTVASSPLHSSDRRRSRPDRRASSSSPATSTRRRHSPAERHPKDCSLGFLLIGASPGNARVNSVRGNRGPTTASALRKSAASCESVARPLERAAQCAR